MPQASPGNCKYVHDAKKKNLRFILHQPNIVNPKGGEGGGQKCPLDTDKALIPSIFIKTSQFLFGES